jgi:hypothetical protein
MVGLGMWTIPAMRTNLFQLLHKRFRFKANLASPTFTGTVSGIDKVMVGLSNVSAMLTNQFQARHKTALDLEASIAGLDLKRKLTSFHRNGNRCNFGDGWLGNVNNTSDLNKPVSAATQTALDLKAV